MYHSFYSAELGLLKIEILEKKYNKAILRINRVLQDKRILFTRKMKAECQLLLSTIYKKKNNLNKAFNHLLEYKEINDSLELELKNKHKTDAALYSEIIFKQVQLQRKNIKEIATKELLLYKSDSLLKQKELKLMVLSFLFILIVLIFILWRKIVLRKKDLIIQQKNTEITKHELVIKNEQKEKLELDIEDNNKKMNTLIVELSNKENSIDKIIHKLTNSSNLTKLEVNNLEIFIKNELELKSTRAQIQHYITEVGDTFFQNLQSNHETLNDNDIKLAGMVVLKMSNKEIGINKNIAVTSVKSAKNRLKKKMGLAQEKSLIDYLSQFL